jgi:hypothetical protein
MLYQEKSQVSLQRGAMQSDEISQSEPTNTIQMDDVKTRNTFSL